MLAGCVSEDLYYGFGRAPNPEDARKCAFIEIDEGDDLVFGGSSMLMMIYANGAGVTQNLDLAIKLACKGGHAPAEFESRIRHLVRLRDQRWTGNDFTICDDITSGYMDGFCTLLQDKFEDQKRSARLRVITDRWSDPDKKAFKELQKAAEAFFDAYSQYEVDLSGTSRAAFQIEARAEPREDFLSSLEQLEKHDFPRFSAAESVQADKQLNSLYRAIQGLPPGEWGTVTIAGIQQTERAWIGYRHAWAKFGREKYLGVSVDSWKTWLTIKRIKMLQEFAPK